MVTLQTIDTRLAKQMQEACALRGVSIVGVPGGWSVMVKVGMTEKPLGTQRTGRVRQWRSLDTLVDYLKTELGIVRIEGIDASGHNPASVFNARPDVSGRMKQVHSGMPKTVGQMLMAMPDVGRDEDFARDRGVGEMKGMVPAPEKPVPVEAMKIGGQTLKEMIEDGRS